jgi:hypothetical protein
MAYGVGHTLFGLRPDIAIRDEGAGSTQPGSSAKKTSRHIAARRDPLVEARKSGAGGDIRLKKVRFQKGSLVRRYRAATQSAIGRDA